MVKYCPKCGNASYDSAPKCGNCGYDFAHGSTKKESEKTDSIKNQLLGSFKDLSGSTSGEEKRSSSTSFNKPSFNIKKPDFSNFNLNREKPEKEKPSFQDKDPVYLTDSEKYEMFKASQSYETNYDTSYESTEIKNTKVKTTEVKTTKIEPKKEKTPQKTKEEPDVFSDIKTVFKTEDSPKKGSSLDFLNKVSRKYIAIFVVLVAILAIILVVVGLTAFSGETTQIGPGNYSGNNVAFSYPTNWSQYNNTGGNTDAGEVAFRTPDKTVIGFSCINSSDITLDNVVSSINQTAKSLDGKIISVNNTTIDGENATDVVINTTGHGYSRYISVIHDGTYYNWVINNAKSSNPYLNSTDTTEINKMISSIHFTN